MVMFIMESTRMVIQMGMVCIYGRMEMNIEVLVAIIVVIGQFKTGFRSGKGKWTKWATSDQ